MKRKWISIVLITVLIFCGCGKTSVGNKKTAEEIVDQMSLEEKVAQLFIICPESIVDGISVVTAAGDTTKEAIDHIPVGGFIYLENNLQSEEQTKKMLKNVRQYSVDRIGLEPFLCVDEEGGQVSRLCNTGNFDVPEIEDMAKIGQDKDFKRAREVGNIIGEYLHDFGFNVDFAPVADVFSNPENEIVKTRSFGTDPKLVSKMALETAHGIKEKGVYPVYKHFPGHGATKGDTHEGYAYTDKTLEQLEECELLPFKDGVKDKIPFMMVGHISLPQIIGDHTPASLSKIIMTDLLRNEMGYQGVIVTDAMNMGAIVQQYTSEEAAVKALQSGTDIILMPDNFNEAYEGVLKAVKEGILTEDRIDESVKRIVKLKQNL